MRKFFINIFLTSILSCSIYGIALSQDKQKFYVELGTDVPKLIQSINPAQQKYELECFIYPSRQTKQLVFLFQLGYRYQQSDKKNYIYTIEGAYWRAGLLYPFHAWPTSFTGGVGLLWSMAHFNDWINVPFANRFWGNFEEQTPKRYQFSYWIEIPVIMKWYIQKKVYIKAMYSSRLILRNPRITESFPVYTVVGYGSTSSPFIPSLTLTTGFVF